MTVQLLLVLLLIITIIVIRRYGGNTEEAAKLSVQVALEEIVQAWNRVLWGKGPPGTARVIITTKY